MTLTDVQVRLLSIIEKRNELKAKADGLKDAALTLGGDPGAYVSYVSILGHIYGLEAALDAFTGLEPIKSLEYLASKPEAAKSQIPLEDWKLAG